MFIITDDVLRQVEDQVLAYPPERGGALLGPPGKPVVTAFVLDSDAQTTSASYVPSRRLTERVRELESVSGLELKGIKHSHPGSMNWLSGPDHHAVARGLEANPHLSEYLCPIVTANRIGLSAHAAEQVTHNEIPLAGGKITFYVGRRRRAGGVDISEIGIAMLPVRRDVQEAADQLGAESVADLGMVEIEGRTVLARQLILPGDIDLTLMFGLDYPVLPPLALLGLANGETKTLNMDWHLDLSATERLRCALNKHFRRSEAGDNRYRLAWGPTTSEPLTEDADAGRAARWHCVVTNIDANKRGTEVRDAALARTRGLLPTAVSEKVLLIVGAGSVGSYMADQFVRSGFDRLALVDPDGLELANISRSCYQLGDALEPGLKKVDALARHLMNINPLVRIERRPVSVQDLGVDELDKMVQAADLVVGAADDPLGQHALSRFAFARGKPAIFVGLYAGARGGEVVLSVPGRTPCFQCATNFRRAMEREVGQVSARTDYGTGRLAGEVALGADVQHVASAAVKLGISLVAPGDTSNPMRDHAERALAQETPYLLMGMVADYWFFPEIFHDTPGQLAFQSVWATAERDPQCSVCGEEGARRDPRDVPLKAPSAIDFRRALAVSAVVPVGRVTDVLVKGGVTTAK